MGNDHDANQPKAARLKDLLAEALDLPETDRHAFLASACGNDRALFDEAESLLRAAEASGFLKSPTASFAPDLPPSESAGGKIGPYKLLQQIGEGGFGAVFMAEQTEPIRRRVALKVIKLGMDTRQVVARFEQERQALAVMDHPNIAKVFDAGATESGRPYFVMELVKGQPITEYCDRQGLSIPERLELFSQVCHAVQHAHTKGVIHRDIKPRNVLVSTHDGKPLVKVIDFGIAKATDQRMTEKTLFTEHQAMIGTPEYMSPEQAEGSLDIDTRTDVYSLGVLLYELLTGATPFDGKALREAGYGEICRIIREVDPPRPSLRVSTKAQAAWAGGSVGSSSSSAKSSTPQQIASVRRTEPGQLLGILKGDLDWVVMKALEKDRARRYATPTTLAEDVARYLAGEAVTAVPPSRVYRVRKFVRRNRTGVVAGGAVAMVVAVGSTAVVWQAMVASQQRDAAIAAKSLLESENASLEGVFKQVLVESLGGTEAMRSMSGIGGRVRTETGEEYSWWLDYEDSGNPLTGKISVDGPAGAKTSMRPIHLVLAEFAIPAIRGQRTANAILKSANASLLAARRRADKRLWTSLVQRGEYARSRGVALDVIDETAQGIYLFKLQRLEEAIRCLAPEREPEGGFEVSSLHDDDPAYPTEYIDTQFDRLRYLAMSHAWSGEHALASSILRSLELRFPTPAVAGQPGSVDLFHQLGLAEARAIVRLGPELAKARSERYFVLPTEIAEWAAARARALATDAQLQGTIEDALYMSVTAIQTPDRAAVVSAIVTKAWRLLTSSGITDAAQRGLEAIEEALRAAPEQFPLHTIRAHALLQLHRLDDATDALNLAVTSRGISSDERPSSYRVRFKSLEPFAELLFHVTQARCDQMLGDEEALLATLARLEQELAALGGQEGALEEVERERGREFAEGLRTELESVRKLYEGSKAATDGTNPESGGN